MAKMNRARISSQEPVVKIVPIYGRFTTSKLLGVACTQVQIILPVL